MSSLRRALEDGEVNTGDGKMVVMKGPLSSVYTDALQQALAKDDQTTVAIESQELDSVLLKKLTALMNQDNATAPTNNFQTVYGVSKAEVDKKVVANVTKELAAGDGENTPEGQFILVYDLSKPGDNSELAGNTEERMEYVGALETMVLAHNGKVFPSFGDYLNFKFK
jgi:hypothetical protein